MPGWALPSLGQGACLATRGWPARRMILGRVWDVDAAQDGHAAAVIMYQGGGLDSHVGICGEHDAQPAEQLPFGKPAAAKHQGSAIRPLLTGVSLCTAPPAHQCSSPARRFNTLCQPAVVDSRRRRRFSSGSVQVAHRRLELFTHMPCHVHMEGHAGTAHDLCCV